VYVGEMMIGTRMIAISDSAEKEAESNKKLWHVF
jgi:hypothetical protein